jgi:hypothetical protein
MGNAWTSSKALIPHIITTERRFFMNQKSNYENWEYVMSNTDLHIFSEFYHWKQAKGKRSYFDYCTTRLRIDVKDKDLVNLMKFLK